MIFLDTSAVMALADSGDEHHAKAVAAMAKLTAEGDALLTHNYVLVESAALLQRRLGLHSSLAFLKDAEKLTVHWITPGDHDEAVGLLKERNRRRLSFVDCMSFVVMRKYGVTAALAYDADFEAEGFEVRG